MTCIITGCALVDDWEGRAVWGDLHRIGGAWVFNAVLGPSGEAAWQHDAPVPDTMKQLVMKQISDEGCFFERRGVIVVRESAAQLNEAAKRYLEGAPA